MSLVRGVRDALKSIVPNWLSNRLGKNKRFKVLWTWALLADGIVDVMFQGFRAALPGKGTPTALSLIGQTRGIPRGTQESDDAYAKRLLDWLTLWQNAGSDEVLLQLIQVFLGPDVSGPAMVARVIDRAGNFTSIDPSGNFTRTRDTNWNWDGTSNPERVGWWSDIWIVIYVDSSRWPIYTSLTDTSWVNAWGNANGLGWGFGHQVPRQIVDGINAIIATFKGAHTFVQSVIISTDTTLFVPGSITSSGNPNGKWGFFSYPDANNSQAPIRTIHTGSGDIRYWCPPHGG